MKNLIISLICFIVGGAAVFFGSGQIKAAKQSSDWPTVQGSVVSSEVSRSRSSGGKNRTKTTYQSDVLYDYVVNGTTYSANKVSFGEVGRGTPAPAREIVNRYPKGKNVTVYYNPDKPETAVLEPGMSAAVYFVSGFGGVFLFFGLLVLFGKMR